jgi:hypothetical protein
MLYFQGTDNKLWAVNIDGSGGFNVGGYKTKSPPVVFGSHLYFQGTDDKLWQVNLDGSGGIDLGGYKTNSTPVLTNACIYFQGTDDKLSKVRLDGTGGIDLGGYKTKSTPVVTANYVYFQGTDDKLWRINLDGSGGTNLGGYKTASRPCVAANYVYFQGTDNKFWRIDLDGSHGVDLGGYATKSTPCVTSDLVYFQGTDDKLWRINLNGSGGTNLGGYKTKSSPMVADNFIFFQGTDNKLWRLNMDGSGGVHLGGFDTASTPFVVQAANQPVTGSVLPKYQVLLLLYAPPGTNGGKSTSTVDYGASSTAGTTTSNSSSFKAGVDISVQVSGSIGPVSLGATADFTYSHTTTNTNSIQVSKSTSNDIKCAGPGEDGINHDHDLFYLWLNPMMNVAIDPQNNISWQLGTHGPTMMIQYVYVSWLKNPSSMPPGVKQQLDAAALTEADYQQILALNPFSSGAAAIDPIRFAPCTQSFPYIPPLSASDPVPTDTYAQQNSVTHVNTQSSENSYGVSVSVSEGIKAPFTASMKETGTLTWTNTATATSTTANAQTASVTIGGPAFGYTGPTDVLVYWDTMFSSFMFAFASEAPAVAGSVAGAVSQSLASRKVTLTVGGRTFSTFANSKGEFRLFGAPSGQGTLTFGGKSQPVSVGPGTPKATVSPP